MKLIAGEHLNITLKKSFKSEIIKQSNTRWTCVIKSAEKFLNGLTRGIERYM